MPTYQQDFDKMEQLRQSAAQANRQGAILTGESKTFADRIKEGVRTHLATQGVDTLSQAIGETTGQLVSEPANIRARMYDVNPLDVDAASARQMAQSLASLATLGEIKESRGKTIEGIIGAGTNRLVAEAKKKEAEAQAANDEAKNILEFVKFKETQAQNAFERQYKMAQLNDKKTPDYITGNPNVDRMSDSEAVATANRLGYKFTGGTMEERAAKSREALNRYDTTGKFDYRFLKEDISPKVVEKIDAIGAIVQTVDDLIPRLQTGENLTGPVKGRVSGFLSSKLGISGKSSKIGKELEELSADKIKERYGGALTTTEVERLTRQAITGANVQESDNLQSLEIIKKNAINELRQKLKDVWTNEQIEQYISELSQSQDEWVDTGRTR